jgi:hypothetical protein
MIVIHSLVPDARSNASSNLEPSRGITPMGSAISICNHISIAIINSIYHCGYVLKEIINTYHTQVLTIHWIKAFLSSIASFCHQLPCGSHEISVGFACSNNLDAEFETKKITLL